MDNLLIIGAGQYGSVVYEIARSTKNFDKIDFLDDSADKALGKICDASKFLNEYQYAIVAMGNPELRLSFIRKLTEIGFQIPVICSPMAYISPSAYVGKGTIIEPMSVIHSNTQIGNGCLVCAGAVINHNATVEDGCQIDCNAVVCSSQNVPQFTKLPCGKIFSGNRNGDI